jgi:hypothetical protein
MSNDTYETKIELIPKGIKAVFKAAYNRYKNIDMALNFCNKNYRHQLTKEQCEKILAEKE